MTDRRAQQWQEAYEASKLRDAQFTTMSGIPLEPVYGPDDGEFPGVYPYTRGPYASMYRSKLWTMRMFAGFGTAEDTNWRFKEIIKAGGDGLSTAFDMPTLLGIDSDDPMALGEVGRCGVAIDSLADMEDLYRGLDVGSITTSMTINSPAAVILAMFVAQAEKAGIERARLGGTLQNDILKEYQAQKEFVFPPRPSMRLVRDTIAFTAAEMPRWHSVSISGYHIREAGSTAAEELAFTLANGFAYVELALQAGLPVDAFAPRLSFFFNAHIDFFEEIAKYRAARRIWARWMRERYGAAGRAVAAAALPHPDRGRVADRPAGRDQHRAHGDRGARRRARRHAVAAHQLDGRGAGPADREGGADRAAHAADHRPRDERGPRRRPAGGLVVRRGADRRDGAAGRGALRPPRRASAGDRCSRAASGGSRTTGSRAGSPTRRTSWSGRSTRAGGSVVGVNRFTEGSEENTLDILQITNEDEVRQLKRLEKVRQDRDQAAVDAALARLREQAADPEVNLMPALIDAATTYATLGETMRALADVFGRHTETPTI